MDYLYIPAFLLSLEGGVQLKGFSVSKASLLSVFIAIKSVGSGMELKLECNMPDLYMSRLWRQWKSEAFFLLIHSLSPFLLQSCVLFVSIFMLYHIEVNVLE